MLRIGSVTLKTPLLLAPIAGYCDLAFRLIVRSIKEPSGEGGVGLACTDLLCPQALLSENDKSMWLAATCAEDRPLCMQLYGANADILADAARWAEGHGATTIDINMGCPVDKVTKKNGGSMLLCTPGSTVELARKVVNAVKVPVTAKVRLGWDDSQIVAPELAVALAGVGIAAITVHGRTTQQMFKPSVRLDGIARVVEAVKSRFPGAPVIGNGDVKSAHDAKHMMDVTGCDGVMIGRGALGQPWIFRDASCYLRTGFLPPPIARADRARIVLEHFETLLRLRASHGPATLRDGRPPNAERIALNMIRSRMSWYSVHLQPWPGLRQWVQAVQSAAEFREFMLRGIERIEAGGEEPSLSEDLKAGLAVGGASVAAGR